MILLDTDHVSLFKDPGNERAVRLRGRLEALPDGETVPGLRVENWLD